MKWYDRFMSIDRRIIFILIGLACIIPAFINLGMPVQITKEVRAVFDYIETLPEGSAVLFACDYGPSTEAECHPMAYALVKHCYARGIIPLGLSMFPDAVGLGEQALVVPAEEWNAAHPDDQLVSGEDYVFLGYMPGVTVVMMQIGEDITQAFPQDYYDVPTAGMPALENVSNYDDIGLVVSLAGSGIAGSWITYAHERYRATVALGVTGVMATDYYPNLQAGQIIGLLGGLKGAAEYEMLVDQKYGDQVNASGRGLAGMDVQSVAHVLIVILIIIGNVGYFASRRRTEPTGPKGR
jgi:hypothetical protein